MYKKVLSLFFVSWLIAVRAASPGNSLQSSSQERLLAELRSRASELEQAFNRGDAAGVISQYDPSLTFVSQTGYSDYDQRVQELRELISHIPRPRLELEITLARPLGRDYAVSLGSYHMRSSDGSDSPGAFSTISVRSPDGQWKIVYSHVVTSGLDTLR